MVVWARNSGSLDGSFFGGFVTFEVAWTVLIIRKVRMLEDIGIHPASYEINLRLLYTPYPFGFLRGS